MLPMLTTDIYVVSLPELVAHFQVQRSTVVFTLASYMLGYAMSLLLAGVFSDQFGRRPVILVGLSVCCLASIGCTLSDTIYELILFRFVQGLGIGCGTLLARVVVRDMYDFKNQISVLSKLSAVLALSPTIGPSIGAFLSDVWGWKAPFYFCSGVALAGLVLSASTLSESLRPEDRAAFSLRRTVRLYGDLLTSPHFLSYSLIISFGWAVYFSFVASSPFVFRGVFELSQFECAVLFGAIMILYSVGTQIARRLSSRVSVVSLLCAASIALFVACQLVLALSARQGHLVTFAATVSLVLMSVGVIFPLTQAEVVRPYKNQVGAVSGLFYCIEMVFGAATGWLVGTYSDSPLEVLGLIFSVSSLAVLLISLARFRKASVEFS